VLWVLIGWQFTVAEFVGGLLLVVSMSLLLRVFVSERLERQAREHARSARGGHTHEPVSEPMRLAERLTSIRSWVGVTHNLRSDWSVQPLGEEGR